MFVLANVVATSHEWLSSVASATEEEIFFFLVVSMTCKSSGARDWTRAMAMTQATAVMTLDSQPAEPPRNSIFNPHFVPFTCSMAWNTPDRHLDPEPGTCSREGCGCVGCWLLGWGACWDHFVGRSSGNLSKGWLDFSEKVILLLRLLLSGCWGSGNQVQNQAGDRCHHIQCGHTHLLSPQLCLVFPQYRD